jgi:hypothetical protein
MFKWDLTSQCRESDAIESEKQCDVIIGVSENWRFIIQMAILIGNWINQHWVQWATRYLVSHVSKVGLCRIVHQTEQSQLILINVSKLRKLLVALWFPFFVREYGYGRIRSSQMLVSTGVYEGKQW